MPKRSASLTALFLSAAVIWPAAGTWADLVSHWKLDGDLADSGPSGNAGSFVGGPDIPFAPGVDDRLDGAVFFDGVDDFIEIAEPSGLPIYDNLAYSVAFWVKGGTQAGRAVYWEADSRQGGPAFRIGPDSSGGTGRVEVLVAVSDSDAPLDHRLSAGTAFDDEWHHIAWVDDNGSAALYIDGLRDASDFKYTRTKLPFESTSIGGVVREEPCCFFNGAVDDVRVYDHALTESEVLQLLESAGCPAAGDTHCGELLVEPPPAGEGAAGTYLAIALGARDDSGDEISYFFRAASESLEVLTAGPQDDNIAAFDLGVGTWTVSVTVDDDRFCLDAADDATCAAPPVTVDCPAEGDTHCGELQITRLADGAGGDGGPGRYSVVVIGATDDSGDEILYTFTAFSDEGRIFERGPQTVNFVDMNLSEGTWTFEATVDDDLDCPDVALDATCSEQVVTVGCPEEGDSHCDGLRIDVPEGSIPGAYVATVQSATDDSGDFLFYTFRAESDDGRTVEVGPLESISASLSLAAGVWTVSVSVDDDPICDDETEDAVCTETLVVSAGDPQLISRWTFDQHTFDLQKSGNDGFFIGELAPVYVDGFDGSPEGAILFDGVEGCVDIQTARGLPLLVHAAFTIAMWVKAEPQPRRALWSEGSSFPGDSLFTIGTGQDEAQERVDVFLRSPAGPTVIPHLVSDRAAFDGEWHHIAWVDDGGRASLYIDGVRDATDFWYRRVPMQVDKTAVGCLLRAEPSELFQGAIDEVRVYNYALGRNEILELVPEPLDCPQQGDTHCDDLLVEPPPGGRAGTYTLSAAGAVDDSGDAVLYTFTAENDEGRILQAGPHSENSASFDLAAGIWNLSVNVDDDLLCRDKAGDGTCRRQITVEPDPKIFVSHWTFDADLADSREASNDAAFFGEDQPSFVEDRDGRPASALRLDGVDDHLLVVPRSGLPLYANREYSLAMWVKGGPQDDKRIWSESSSTLEAPQFSIGTNFRASSGQVDIYVRDRNGVVVVRHALSSGEAFDGTWHHIAWTDAGGDAVLYIDGKPDPVDFSYEKPDLPLDTTTIGGVVSQSLCCTFEGVIDDVRAYNYALSEEEVRAIAVGSEMVKEFRRGDANDDGGVNITDAVYALNFLFTGGPPPPCNEAADVDDDGAMNITDGVYLLSFLFLGGSEPVHPAVSPGECGPDSEDSPDIGCEIYQSCPGE